MMKCRAVGGRLAFALILAAALPAQDTSSLQGVVRDPSGAVVPGARIEIVHIATEAALRTVSNDAGLYRFPQVTPGAYDILAAFEGFKPVAAPGVTLLVNQPLSIDLQFTEVGMVAEAITVEARTAQINTVDASMGNAVGARAILELPFEARNVVKLLSLQPGVAYIRDTEESVPNDTRNGAVNGGKSDQANIALDGVDVNDQQEGLAFESVLRMTLDSVQEFRTTTFNAGADQGRSSGAQVSLVTKSGSNAFHGSLYHYLRHEKTAANSFFNNAAPASPDNPEGGIERERLRRNLFGGSLGGPIRKNRLFFFYNYEGRRDRSEESAVRTVPSETLREGFVRYLRSDGSVATLDPDTIRNVIDPLGIGVSQSVLDYFRRYPAPNDDTAGDGLNTLGFRFKSPIETNLNTHIAKFDWYADSSARHHFFWRGNLQDDDGVTAQQFPASGPVFTTLVNTKGLAAGYNTTISPSLFSAFRYGYTRQGVNRAGASGGEVVQFRGLDDLTAASFDNTRIVPVHTFREDLSWVSGNHQVSFGGVVRLIDNNRSNWENTYHYALVNSSWLERSGAELSAPVTDLARNFTTAYRWAMASALGLVSEVNSVWNYNLDGGVRPAGAPVERVFAQEQYEIYVQDSWRVARGLNLTAGVRYGLSPPVHEKNGFQTYARPSLGAWFDRRGALMQQGRSQAEAGEIEYDLAGNPGGRPLYPYHKKNFAPRVAVAYSPQAQEGFRGKLFGGPGRTSIRAGFGMFYDNFGQGVIRFFDRNALGLSTTLASPFGVSVSESPRFVAFNQVPPEGITPAPEGGFPQKAPAIGDVNIAMDDTIQPPYSMALNFAVGRELPHGFFVEAAYAGRLSRRSLVQRDLAIPADITDPDSGATYFEAAQQMAALTRAETQVENVAPIPYFENMFPALAGDGLTATQTAYLLYSDVAPDWTAALATLDSLGLSRLGSYAFFNQQYRSLTAWSSIAGGSYHAGQLTLRKRWSHGVQMDLNYTFSKSIDLGSAAERVAEWTDLVLNPWSPGQMKAVSDYDVRHQVNANWVAELPFGERRKWGARWNRPLQMALGGWSVSGLWRMTSALNAAVSNGGVWPTNWQRGGFATQTGSTPQQGVFKDAPAVQGNPGPNLFANPAAALGAWSFTDPGESGQRNGVRGDGYFTIDLGLAKRFPAPWEGHTVQFRWEVFNMTNSARFDPRSASLSLTRGASFGKYRSLLTNPRVMQFALRYDF